MTTIVVDTSVRDQLQTARDVVEFRDPAGRVIGRYAPVPSAEILAGLDLPSDEELDRRTRESRRFTADEVMNRIRSLKGKRDGG